MSKKIEVNISSRYFYIFLIAGILILGAFGVYAYNTNSPSTFGHTISELDPPYQCNGYLKFDATNRWTCGTPSSSGGSTPITCTGANKGLQWTGSSWVCATFTDSSLTCNWDGWNNGCGNFCQFDSSTSCSNDPARYVSTSKFCSNGVITSSKTVTCCPDHGSTGCLQVA